MHSVELGFARIVCCRSCGDEKDRSLLRPLGIHTPGTMFSETIRTAVVFEAA